MQARRLVRAARRHNNRQSCGQSRHKGRRRHRRHLNRNSSCEDHRHHQAVRRSNSRRSCGQFRRNRRRRPRHHNRRHKSVACSRLRRSPKYSRRHSQGTCNRRRKRSLHRSQGRCNLRRSRFSRHLSNGPLRLRSSSKSARRRNPAKSLPNPRGNGSTKKRAAAWAARQFGVPVSLSAAARS